MNAFDTKDWRANPGTKHERQLLDQAREATLVFVIERISGYNGRVWVDGGGGPAGVGVYVAAWPGPVLPSKRMHLRFQLLLEGADGGVDKHDERD